MRDTGLPEVILSDLQEFPEMAGDVLMAADELDRAARDEVAVRAEEGDPDPTADVWPDEWDGEGDESSCLDEALLGMDDEPLTPGPEVRGLRVVFSRPSLDRARELGLPVPGVTAADHHREAERELRAAAREHPGTLFAMAVADADEVAAFAQEQGLDPSDETTIGVWAEDMFPNDSPNLLPWPPERNGSCWCGSGRKYKKCCGSPASR